ncbi:MAG: hypothetical protein QOI16_3956, partial [Pseudonocardiales bacterium]|nr:hypothetical protein [Pseudonocardiales bacterium]
MSRVFDHLGSELPETAGRATEKGCADRRDGMNKSFKLFGIALSVAMGGFLVGFDATVISGAVPFLKTYFDLDSAAGSLKLGWAVSSLGWG